MKSFGVTSVLLLTLVLASPSASEAQVLQPGELCSDHADAAIATLEDANLEALIRAALSVGTQDDLTCGLVSRLTELEARNAEIESLVGAQNLTGLTTLHLVDNPVTDISALRGLTNLTTLWLFRNSITDISALSGLMSLTDLRLGGNSITDIRALNGITNLTVLYLHNNSISDISPLSGLTSLAYLHLDNNSISDIEALSRLANLNAASDGYQPSQETPRPHLLLPRYRAILYLHRNPITDIQPLLNHKGLGADALVDLRSTNVNCSDVALLQAKGVTVTSDCS